jgi:hypothetical protein
MFNAVINIWEMIWEKFIEIRENINTKKYIPENILSETFR